MEERRPEIKTEVVTLGAGCFWCVEAIFARLKGVCEVKPGYSGGTIKNPAYREVCTGRTGHAEVCQITFIPKELGFLELLEVFWHIHDPTTLNRQGNDVGTQYRSVVFYHTLEQKRLAEEMKTRLDKQKIWDSPIVTQINEFESFFPAEDYHNDYYRKNSSEPYCSVVITPKLKKFEKTFADYLKEGL